ncbi:MAG TPA: hypothetical protein DHN33_01275 [Eubacteriaceae bacterium]|nr:hypothetical protein [Eubacteriaceae bacterium]
MAVEQTVITTKMVLKNDMGVNEKGIPVVKSKSYNNIDPLSANADVYDAAQLIAGVQVNPLLDVHKVEESVLTNVL